MVPQQERFFVFSVPLAFWALPPSPPCGCVPVLWLGRSPLPVGLPFFPCLLPGRRETVLKGCLVFAGIASRKPRLAPNMCLGFRPPAGTPLSPFLCFLPKTLFQHACPSILCYLGFSVTDEFWRTLESNLNLALWRAFLHSCTGPLLGFALHLVFHFFDQVLRSCMSFFLFFL